MKVTLEDCKNCGICCFFGKRYIGKEWEGIKVGEDGWCVYYDPKKKCTIHEERPEVCREFKTGCPECIDLIEKKLQGWFDSK